MNYKYDLYCTIVHAGTAKSIPIQVLMKSRTICFIDLQRIDLHFVAINVLIICQQRLKFTKYTRVSQTILWMPIRLEWLDKL